MACMIVHDSGRTTIRLAGDLDDRDFNDIEAGFELALDRRCPSVVFDFSGLPRITASVRALLGVLRLQGQRAGTRVELRNLAPEFGAILAEFGGWETLPLKG